MPIIKYAAVRFLLFAIPFVVCLWLHLGLIASAVIGAIVSFCLSYLLMGSLRNELNTWAVERRTKHNEKVKRSDKDNAAEDALIE